MLDNEKTLEILGYSAELISDGSNKSIYLVCDYCDKSYASTKKKRKKSNQFCGKDACNDCRLILVMTKV